MAPLNEPPRTAIVQGFHRLLYPPPDARTRDLSVTVALGVAFLFLLVLVAALAALIYWKAGPTT